MQVTTSSFATFFAFLALVAPLGTQALQITTPTAVTTGNVIIECTKEINDPASLTLFLVKNNTVVQLADNVVTTTGKVTVSIPASATGDGWQIFAANPANNAQVGVSTPFTIASAVPVPKGNGPTGPAVIAGVVIGLFFFSLLIFALFFYLRRRRQQFTTGPVFNLEHSFPPPEHTRSFSSTSSKPDAEMGEVKDMEQEKIQWEMQLEAQFARARASTPDVPRGGTSMSRASSASPPRAPPMALPQRTAPRKERY
ncbi:hypothetical protein C8F04DRAFT_133621 [Mycena alexandri]|uniref:Uncharacterized protein n=1 Tax=Mycena alexandri TaxID=1745969 RepID=A0AAD6WUR8_9AGAR|nr:hypothetical protein C8F04DRAFT_133621 [Mycena alexandri]